MFIAFKTVSSENWIQLLEKCQSSNWDVLEVDIYQYNFALQFFNQHDLVGCITYLVNLNVRFTFIGVF